MDFHLTKEQLLVRKMYREFAENEVKPLAAEIDEEERFPMETVEKMAKLGMMGIYFPKEYGGAGGDVLSYAMCVEELAKVCGTTAVIVSAHTSLCCAPIFEHGTEAQKQKYLPDLLSGKKIGAFGLTEPGAGTDAQGQQTTAVLDESGENYILNGSKCFITNGNVADTFVIIAVTGKTTDKRGRAMKEISAFVVEKTDPGFTQGKHEKKMGIRGSSTCDLIFEDCVIPKDRMLGKKGQGFKIAMQTLDGGRIGIASQALGLGEGAVEEAVKYTKERVQFGKRISQFQNTQFQLAEMHTRMQAAQFLVYSAAMKKQNHEPYSMDAAMAKLFAADAASDAAIRIGISPWGFEGEFAVREALEQHYHLLLGGGPGAAFAGEVNAQAPGLIWSRADKDGRSVMAIDIMALPEPGVPFAWEWGLSMQAQEVRLTSAVPSDPHMEALVAGKAAR